MPPQRLTSSVATEGDLAERGDQRPVVAQVNYAFFQSTQSYIYFYLAYGRRFRSVCLTRQPESRSFERAVPAALVPDLYPYGSTAVGGVIRRAFELCSRTTRRIATRLPPRLAAATIDRLERRIVPLLRAEANAGRYLDWASRILTERKARLIHAYFGPVAWRALELRRRLGLPLVVSLLGDEVGARLDPWWDWWIKRGSEPPDWPARFAELLTEADLVLVEGPHLRERVLALGGPPEKVRVQRIAIPVQGIPFRARRREGTGKTVLMFAGRFCEQKGLLYLLRAVRELWRDRHDFELRLIGDERLTDGKYAALVYDYIRAHRLQACVRPLGFLNHQDYLREMAQADLFLHPSVVAENGATEGGAPTTILDAQALGMPVISTEHCDIPNVTVPGQSAVLVAERDVDALTDAIRSLLDAPERWADMGRAGRQHVELHHDVDREVEAMEDAYHALLRST